jgi:hypothetical protein
MSTAIVKHQPLTPETWEMIRHVAPVMRQAQLFGVATESQAAAIMLKGHELGLSLTASFEFINVIRDKPGLIPRGALALILGSSEYDGMKIEDIADSKGNPTACKVWMKRKNGLEYTAQFTMEDAKRADLIKPDSGWSKYPSNMMRWRAIGFCADIVFPDVLGGMKRVDELGADITPDGEIIQGSWTVQKEVPQPPKPQKTIQVALNELMQRYAAEKILEANNGSIPSTMQEIEAVIAKLEQEAADVSTITVDVVPEVEP